MCPRLGAGPCITSCYMHSNKRFAFLEFRSAEEANNCMAFDGIIWGTDNLKVSSRKGEPDGRCLLFYAAVLSSGIQGSSRRAADCACCKPAELCISCP